VRADTIAPSLVRRQAEQVFLIDKFVESLRDARISPVVAGLRAGRLWVAGLARAENFGEFLECGGAAATLFFTSAALSF
jgi:hypothetical protein